MARSRILVTLVTVLLLLGGGVRAEALAVVDLAGRPVDPFASPEAAATVFVFVRTDCPLSNRYAPELHRIHAEFAERGVAIWLVYPDPDEPVETIRKHLAEYAHPFPALRDPRHDLVKRTGARVTPEAVVFTGDGRQVYRGRIDNRFVDFGRGRPKATVHDLEDAIGAVLADRPIVNATTRAIGCFIPPLE